MWAFPFHRGKVTWHSQHIFACWMAFPVFAYWFVVGLIRTLQELFDTCLAPTFASGHENDNNNGYHFNYFICHVYSKHVKT